MKQTTALLEQARRQLRDALRAAQEEQAPPGALQELEMLVSKTTVLQCRLDHVAMWVPEPIRSIHWGRRP